jgi:hypothetical protein
MILDKACFAELRDLVMVLPLQSTKHEDEVNRCERGEGDMGGKVRTALLVCVAYPITA